MHVVEFISKQRWSTLIVAGAVLLILVGVGAYFATGQLLEFSVFFIVPISFFTWFVGRNAGLIASGLSAGFTLAANLESPVHPVHPHVAYWNALVWLAFFVLITIIIAELKVLYLRERRLSRVDNLTGIATRLAFYEVAEAEKNRAKRYQHSMAIAYLDLDHFKEVNDSEGHAVGDKALVAVAWTIENTIRQTDTLARMGGDEFAIILPNTRRDAAGRVLSKVLRALRHYPGGPMKLVRSSISIVSGLPCVTVRSAPAIVFSGPAQRSLTLRPVRSPSHHVTLYTESSDSFVASAAASIATGWSEPVPGRELHPLKSSAFHGALFRQQRPNMFEVHHPLSAVRHGPSGKQHATRFCHPARPAYRTSYTRTNLKCCFTFFWSIVKLSFQFLTSPPFFGSSAVRILAIWNSKPDCAMLEA